MYIVKLAVFTDTPVSIRCNAEFGRVFYRSVIACVGFYSAFTTLFLFDFSSFFNFFFINLRFAPSVFSARYIAEFSVQ